MPIRGADKRSGKGTEEETETGVKDAKKKKLLEISHGISATIT
jgi:hypothetical protein